MSGKQRIGCHKRLQLIKRPAPNHLGLHGQSYPLLVGESKPLSFELILEHTVLFDEIIDDRLLLAVKPACQGDYNEVERLDGDCHCTNRLYVILFDNNIIQLVQIFAPYAKSRVFWFMNFMPGNQNYLGDIAKAVASHGVLMGGPDVPAGQLRAGDSHLSVL